MTALVSTVLAHQGGWDEVLLITGPIVVIAGLLILAKKRVDDAARSAGEDERRDEAASPDHGRDGADVD